MISPHQSTSLTATYRGPRNALAFWGKEKQTECFFVICKANYIGTEFVLTQGEAIITPLQRTLPSPLGEGGCEALG